MDVRRRGFLFGKGLTREGREQVRRQTRPLGPAPPWHRGRLDTETCGACSGPCADACEPRIIRFHPGDHDLAGTPWLSFEDGGCTFCRACAEACPMELEMDGPCAIGVAALDAGRCLAHNGVICMSCRAACDRQALAFDRRFRPTVLEDRCNGCGCCLRVCPGQALRVDPGAGTVA